MNYSIEYLENLKIHFGIWYPNWTDSNDGLQFPGEPNLDSHNVLAKTSHFQLNNVISVLLDMNFTYLTEYIIYFLF